MTSLILGQHWFSVSEGRLHCFRLFEVDLGGSGNGKQVLHAGLDHVGNIGDDDVWQWLESRLHIGGGGFGLSTLLGLGLVLDCERRRVSALRVIGRVHLGEHVNGLAHPQHVKSSETFFLLIGGFCHR